ncbi:hypothetical protein H4R18_000168 [Coemansia javaensis]|uniref:SANT domain-containing protein n=1 Tax=Coemansia javaensis TaxID=2761396 RepID=A0A9W8LN63_9FUNG|nr:hypothetical protein H4R18_000168 [Coemansia javaensis]
MPPLTSLRVSKGTSKFTPKAKPRAAGRERGPQRRGIGAPRPAPDEAGDVEPPVSAGGTAIGLPRGREEQSPPPPLLATRSAGTPIVVGAQRQATQPDIPPRLASLSSPVAMRSASVGPSVQRTRPPRPPRLASPPKRARTDRDAAQRATRPRLKTTDDYEVLSTDAISRMPIAYFCRDSQYGRPTQEFVDRENEALRKIHGSLEPEPEPEPESRSRGSSKPTTPATSRPTVTPRSAGSSKPPVTPRSALSHKTPTTPKSALSHKTPTTPLTAATDPPLSGRRMAAQVRVVNGEVVIDTDSLVISRSAMAEDTGEPLELVDESERPRFINSLTYVKKRGSRRRWGHEETELFYQQLRTFGSDFEMISSVMPNRSRYDIRNKFKLEERKNPQRITDTLLRRRPQEVGAPVPPAESALEGYTIADDSRPKSHGAAKPQTGASEPEPPAGSERP